MPQLLNRYQCPACAHTWKLLASSRTHDRCSLCGMMTCRPYESRLVSQVVCAWRCPTCEARWEGELRDCDCGRPQEHVCLLSLHLQSEEGRFQLVAEEVPPLRPVRGRGAQKG